MKTKFAICISFFFLFFNANLFASSYLTLKSEHFIIYYPEESLNFALKVHSITEDAYDEVVGYLKFEPAFLIPIVIDNKTDLLNASYAPFPNRIELIESVGSDINFFENTKDPIYMLLVHELTHYVNVTTAKGTYSKICNFLGRGTCVLNGISPGWLSEGLAIQAETEFTGGGRGNSSYFDSYSRSFMEDEKLWSLSAAGVSSPYFPPSNRIYIAGYHMLDYLLDEYGEDAASKLSLYQGTYPLGGTKSALFNLTNKDANAFYEDFLIYFREKNKKAKNQILKDSFIEAKTIKSDNFDNFSAFVWNDENKIEAIKTNVKEGKKIVLISPDENIIEDEYIFPFIQAPDQLSKSNDDKFYFANVTPYGFGYPNSFKSDFFSYDLKQEKLKQITKNKHIFTGEISHKSNKIVVLAKVGSGNKILLLDGKKEKTLFFKENVYCSAPSWSDDERYIISACRDRQKSQILLIDLEEDETKTIFDDKSFKREPSFSKDSKWILFSSNRQNNIFDIYAYNIEEKFLYKASSTLYGAFSPKLSPDGKKLAFLSFDEGLKKINVIDFEPKKFRKIAEAHFKDEDFKADISYLFVKDDDEYNKSLNILEKNMPLLQSQLNQAMLRKKESLKDDAFFLSSYIPFVHMPYIASNETSSFFGVYLLGADPVFLDSYTADISYNLDSSKFDYDIFLQDSRIFPYINFRFYDSEKEKNIPFGYKTDENKENFLIREQGAEASVLLSNPFCFNPSYLLFNFEFGLGYQKFKGIDNYIVDKSKDFTLNYFSNIKFERVKNQAARDVVRRNGEDFLFRYQKEINDAGGEVEAENQLYKFSKYFPAFFDNQSFSFSAAYQVQEGYLDYSRDEALPRGYSNSDDDLAFKKNSLLSLEYHFPIKYTDDGIGLILYHSFLIKGSLFIDIGSASHEAFSWDKFWENKRSSIGVTLTNSANIIAICPLEFGLSLAYKTHEKDFALSVLLLLPI